MSWTVQRRWRVAVDRSCQRCSSRSWRLGQVEDVQGLTPAEDFVLHDSDGCAPLSEMAAAWIGSEDPTRCTAEVVSPLAEALVALTANGLIEVRRFTTWPANFDRGLPVDPVELADVSRQAEIRRPSGRLGLMVASITDDGVPWL